MVGSAVLRPPYAWPTKSDPTPGDLPSPIDIPPGCRFAGRCPFAEAARREREPELREIAPGHRGGMPSGRRRRRALYPITPDAASRASG
ncbi:MAG: hypothetical protein R3E48_05300 [Burkholderiaceae bacterium]